MSVSVGGGLQGLGGRKDKFTQMSVRIDFWWRWYPRMIEVR